MTTASGRLVRRSSGHGRICSELVTHRTRASTSRSDDTACACHGCTRLLDRWSTRGCAQKHAPVSPEPLTCDTSAFTKQQQSRAPASRKSRLPLSGQSQPCDCDVLMRPLFARRRCCAVGGRRRGLRAPTRLPMSDTGSEAVTGAAAAYVLAGFGDLASTSQNHSARIASSRPARYPRLAGRCSRRQKCSSLNESGALPALLDPAGWSSPIARRKVA